MKRLRSSDDLHSYGEKSAVKDWGRRGDETGLQRSSSSLHRSSYYRSSDSGRKVLSSSASRYDRLEDERESSKLIRKRPDYDLDNYDRRKSYDRHREGNERGTLSSSPRPGYGMDQMYRSESFSAPRRDFPKGFRSERDRPKREGIAASWRRFGNGKDVDDGARSGSEVSRGSRAESKDVGKAKSPKGVRDRKSPAWSKDSGSERSNSVEVKRPEDVQVESGGPSSEREEGELEPDPQPDLPSAKPVIDDVAADKENSSKKHLDNELRVESKLSQEKVNLSSLRKGEEQAEDGLTKEDECIVSQKVDSPHCRETAFQGAGGSGDGNDAKGENEGGDHVKDGGREVCLEEVADSTCDGKLSTLEEQEEEHRIVDIQVKADDMAVAESVEVIGGSEQPSTEEKTIPSLQDKGKSVAFLPSNGIHFTETNSEVDYKTMDLAATRDIETEGPSTMGFQFFSTDPVKKPEKIESTHNKPKDDKLALELSLSLPNVLLPINSQRQAPASPSHARSVQSFASSFRTNSDGFTASMSFSGSQQFTHNPSCSLTHNALDYEKSVGSKPLFQGVDWKALSLDENSYKEGSAYQGMSSRENNLHQQSQVSQGNSNGQAALQNMRVTGGNSRMLMGLERQISFNKQLSGSQGFYTYENGPEYSRDNKPLLPEKDSGSLHINNGGDRKDQGLSEGAEFAESIVTMIVSEPIHTMARRFDDINTKHLPSIKEFACDIISNPSKQWQLSALKKALQSRSDITLDMLLNANRTQLEILVSLKTGLREFLLQKYDITSSDLAEIFLNMRCRNLSCRSLLPVDECDCKICLQRSDFCRDCMCLVCSKFDMASNTCSWVGCDVCLHWCHADCGLRESHIRNGRSAAGAQGTTEMQFYCVACDHPSEMFGFVKEVFQNFLKEWTAENLSRELEYVRRIFYASEDVRGKQLRDIAVLILSRLANNRSNLQEVQNQIMNFFTETNSERPLNTVESKKELPTRNQEGSKGAAGSSQGCGWMNTVYQEKAAPILGDPVSLTHDKNDKYAVNMDIQKHAQIEPIFDELESIVRIKQAESKMFQARAEDARKESEALKRISVTKSERIEEEFTTRISKLRLAEAEEMRKQKVEELRALEREHREYLNMKMRMETDIKDLLLKMEATRRNLTA